MKERNRDKTAKKIASAHCVCVCARDVNTDKILYATNKNNNNNEKYRTLVEIPEENERIRQFGAPAIVSSEAISIAFQGVLCTSALCGYEANMRMLTTITTKKSCRTFCIAY